MDSYGTQQDATREDLLHDVIVIMLEQYMTHGQKYTPAFIKLSVIDFISKKYGKKKSKKRSALTVDLLGHMIASDDFTSNEEEETLAIEDFFSKYLNGNEFEIFKLIITHGYSGSEINRRFGISNNDIRITRKKIKIIFSQYEKSN